MHAPTSSSAGGKEVCGTRVIVLSRAGVTLEVYQRDERGEYLSALSAFGGRLIVSALDRARTTLPLERALFALTLR